MSYDPGLSQQIANFPLNTAKGIADIQAKNTETQQNQLLMPYKVQQAQQELQAGAQNLDINKIKLMTDKATFALQALSGATPENWAQLRNSVASQGIDVSGVPAEYPGQQWVEQKRMALMPAAQYYNALYKQMTANTNQQKADQQGDYYRSKEGVNSAMYGIPGPANLGGAGFSQPPANGLLNPSPLPTQQAGIPSPPPPESSLPPLGQPAAGPALTPEPNPPAAVAEANAIPMQLPGEGLVQYRARLQAMQFQRKQGETERHNRTMEGNGIASTQLPVGADGKPLSIDELLKAPESPSTNHAIAMQALADGSVKMPMARSPTAMAAWEKEVADMKRTDSTANVNRSASALKFDTGQLGNQTRSFNVLVSHLGTLGELIDALGNNDIRAINSMSQKFSSQFGSAVPTSYDAAKQIVADEIAKAVMGSAGALGDRESLKGVLDRANSPEQLRGVIATYTQLAAGQLKGLEKQYSASTGKSDFKSKYLFPETQSEFGNDRGATSTPSFSSPNDPTFANLPAGAKFIDNVPGSATFGQTLVKH